MSDERERPASRAADDSDASVNAGAPVEETEASESEVLAAVERSRGAGEIEAAVGDDASAVDGGSRETTALVVSGAAKGSGDEASTEVVVAEAPSGTAKPVEAIDEQTEFERRQAASEVDTQLDLLVPGADPMPASTVPFEKLEATEALPSLDELPSAGAEPILPPERDGEIRISPDHPMAALYMQTPMPPDIKGNRGAGVLIALLATIGFAVVHAGFIALTLAPVLAPSQFVDGLLAHLLTWSFAASAAAFFLSLVIVVLVVGRAGWWAYVLGGFLVGLAVWAGAALGLVVDEQGAGALLHLPPTVIVERFGFTLTAVAAGLIGREATVWFGAWIGARGRRVKQRNAIALAEYEEALAEVQAKQAGGSATTTRAL